MKKNFLYERRGESQWGREESMGEGRVSGGGGVSGGGRSKFGEEIKSGDKLKRTMESSIKRSKGRYTRREGSFAVGSIISNK